MSDLKTIAAFFAHPDDEAFTCGGTLASFAAQGVEVSLVCATRGEVGEISDSALATPETLGEVREQELVCACNTLGINPPIFLNYRDSGMAGTPENKHPDAFMNISAAEVIRRLVRQIRHLKPQVVITFDPTGGYGHPDHIAIHHHTVAAFEAAGDPDLYPDQGEAWQADRLYYIAFPDSFFESIYQKLVEIGEDVSEMERFRDGRAGIPIDDISLIQDVADYVQIKWDAFYCHKTQINPHSPFRKVPDDFMKQLVAKEYFILAKPESMVGQKLATLA
ncbi:MAG: PIG-L family deacetylase [Chloroflexota bacterium]